MDPRPDERKLYLAGTSDTIEDAVVASGGGSVVYQRIDVEEEARLSGVDIETPEAEAGKD